MKTTDNLTVAQLDKARTIYADPVKYAAWRLKMGFALPALTLDMDDLTRDHISEVRRLMTEAQLPSAESVRVVAGYRELRQEIDKAAQHMDMGTAILGARQKGQSSDFRTMTPIAAEAQLDDLAERYRKSPVKLGDLSLRESAPTPARNQWDVEVPFDHEPLAGSEPF